MRSSSMLIIRSVELSLFPTATQISSYYPLQCTNYNLKINTVIHPLFFVFVMIILSKLCHHVQGNAYKRYTECKNERLEYSINITALHLRWLSDKAKALQVGKPRFKTPGTFFLNFELILSAFTKAFSEFKS